MKFFQNEKGVTLLEVLLSITILSIIFLSIMTFFPQMGFTNKQNEDKSQGISTAKQILVKWENDANVKEFLANPAGTVIPEYKSDEGNYHIFKTTEGAFSVTIKIKKNPPDPSSTKLKAHLIIVQLLNNKGNVVSVTYGYVVR